MSFKLNLILNQGFLKDSINIFSGDMHSVNLIDMFGFECFHKNHIEQLIVNSFNEQLQYLYNQKEFVWEMQEQV